MERLQAEMFFRRDRNRGRREAGKSHAQCRMSRSSNRRFADGESFNAELALVNSALQGDVTADHRVGKPIQPVDSVTKRVTIEIVLAICFLIQPPY